LFSIVQYTGKGQGDKASSILSSRVQTKDSGLNKGQNWRGKKYVQYSSFGLVDPYFRSGSARSCSPGNHYHLRQFGPQHKMTAPARGAVLLIFLSGGSLTMGLSAHRA
jgi:hypothetical protein